MHTTSQYLLSRHEKTNLFIIQTCVSFWISVWVGMMSVREITNCKEKLNLYLLRILAALYIWLQVLW